MHFVMLEPAGVIKPNAWLKRADFISQFQGNVNLRKPKLISFLSINIPSENIGFGDPWG